MLISLPILILLGSIVPQDILPLADMFPEAWMFLSVVILPFEYIVDVVNGGGIDALFQSIDNNLNASNQDYITIEIKYFDGTEINENDVLRMGQSKRND